LRFLAKLDATEAIPAILPLTRAEDEETRMMAIYALGKLQARESIGDISELASSDPERYVRGWATESVARLDEKAGVALARKALLGDEEQVVRTSALRVLRRHGDGVDLELVQAQGARESSWLARLNCRRTAWMMRARLRSKR